MGLHQNFKNIPFVKFNESELRCDFPNGARITILGAENDCIEGYL